MLNKIGEDEESPNVRGLIGLHVAAQNMYVGFSSFSPVISWTSVHTMI
jgi:hypothetical protein